MGAGAHQRCGRGCSMRNGEGTGPEGVPGHPRSDSHHPCGDVVIGSMMVPVREDQPGEIGSGE